MAIAHVMKCASDILVELKAIHPKRGIIRSIIWIINVKNCSLSTTYNGEMTHPKHQK